jgi:putative transcriptional regulator
MVVLEVDDDGSKWFVMSDGTRQPAIDTTDWERLANMTEEEIEANALSDPDNLPMTDEDLLRSLHMPKAKEIRERMGLSQLEFARRFHLSPYTVQRWEEGELWRDLAGMMILRVIDTHPEAVRDAIERYRRFKTLEEVRAYVEE